MQTLKELIEQLQPDFQQEVRDFVEFLLEKQVGEPNGELKLDWRGSLRDLRDRYTSVELQHKILEWWGDFQIVYKDAVAAKRTSHRAARQERQEKAKQ